MASTACDCLRLLIELQVTTLATPRRIGCRIACVDCGCMYGMSSWEELTDDLTDQCMRLVKDALAVCRSTNIPHIVEDCQDIRADRYRPILAQQMAELKERHEPYPGGFN